MTGIGHSEKLLLMRTFLTVLILFLSIQSLTKADDITDFEIEGISVGDSLLDYFNEEEIITNIDKNVYKNRDGKFKMTGFYGKYGEYDGLQFAFKPNDKKYIIYSINGGIFYTDIEQCKKKLKSISAELSNLFKYSEKNFDQKQIHPADKSKQSYVITDAFFLKSGSASVKCTDWSEEITKKYNWGDNLRVGVKLKEYNDWLQ